MPLIRDYPSTQILEPTDAFVIDRIGVGTLSLEGLVITGGSTRCITYVIDGEGSELTPGVAGDLYIPTELGDLTIASVTLLADQTGSVVVDIWSDTYANFPPTNADTITASTPPTITSGVKSQDTTLTDWTTLISAGNTLRFNVDSVTDITRVTVALAVS